MRKRPSKYIVNKLINDDPIEDKTLDTKNDSGLSPDHGMVYNGSTLSWYPKNYVRSNRLENNVLSN